MTEANNPFAGTASYWGRPPLLLVPPIFGFRQAQLG